LFDHSLFRNSILAGVMLAISLVAIDLIRFPTSLNQGTIALIYILVLALLLAGYTILAVRGTRTWTLADPSALRDGMLCGLLVGVIWIAEIIAGNILDTQQLWVRLVYFGSILSVPVATIIAGVWVSARTGLVASGALLGLWSGLVSGLIVFLALLTLTYIPLGLQSINPPDLAAFQRSGLPDLATYEAGEDLTAAINHLWIGPVLGIIFGSLGGLVGSALAPRKAAQVIQGAVYLPVDDRK
jgi:hypothetical protein